MKGRAHLFVACGDATNIGAHAFLVPTDEVRRIEKSWRTSAGGRFSPSGDDEVCLPEPVERKLADDGVAWAGSEWPGAILVDSGRVDAVDHWYATRVAAALEVVRATGLSAEGRERPLVAAPLLGIRLGGAGGKRGGTIKDVLNTYEQWIDDHDDFDVVVVARDPENYTAAQRLRRPSRWDWLDDDLRAHACRLGDLAAQDRLVLFVGAGASRDSGLADWAGLLGSLAEQAGIGAEDPRRSALAKLPEVDRARVIGEALSRRRPPTTMGQEVVAALGDETAHPSLMTHLLMAIGTREMVTTNYDTLLERAAAVQGVRLSVLPYQRVEPSRPWLLKLHGCVGHPEDIVLTREQFLDYPLQRGALRGLVQAMLMTKHMLFVGYSLRDDNFIGIVHDVRGALRRSSDGPSELGTVISPFADPARALAWNDIIAAPAHPESAKPSADEQAVARRRIEAMLDLVACRAHPGIGHLLARNMEAALDEEERAAREALLPIVMSAKRHPGSPAWDKIRTLLRDLGADA